MQIRLSYISAQGIYQDTALWHFEQQLEKGEVAKTTGRTGYGKGGTCQNKRATFAPPVSSL
ncbi:hypothetical protein JEM65_20210 [Gelidibacter salicanalis]|uniref:Uncharacterized protein n=1 Tax=Gelidibacter salicanalis TaxID=291193 RepID=A0A934KSE7_9FLAO|nr:hypothetical protein [Gelidibacter salicanalis]MBJ7882964.1 hypothetical protein [Gelidibacter salicanalis]